MRLLQRSNTGEFSLTKDLVGDDTIHPYAILSHTWEEGQEVTFQDLIDGMGQSKTGYNKIRFCGQQVERDGLRYFWVDTCCIDKSSSTELSEAINSMFQWYHRAHKCYVYLSDVSIGGSVGSDLSFQQTWKPAFRESRWFTRGWTLQELLASASVEFFSIEGERLGDKISLVQEIHDITGISVRALEGSPLSQFTVDERFSWAERRKTKREEDAAYSLLGIFDIHMPLIYGEGRKSAFNRLHKEIKESLRKKSHALPTSMLFTEQPKRKHGHFSTVPFGKDPDVVELSDVSGVLSACIDALEQIETDKEFRVELGHAAVQFEDDKLRHQEWTNVVGVRDGKRKETHDPRLKSQHSAAIFKRILNLAPDVVDVGERTRPQLRNDSEVHEESFAYIPGLPRGRTKNKNNAALPTSMRGGLGWASRRRGGQVELFLSRNSY